MSAASRTRFGVLRLRGQRLVACELEASTILGTSPPAHLSSLLNEDELVSYSAEVRRLQSHLPIQLGQWRLPGGPAQATLYSSAAPGEVLIHLVQFPQPPLAQEPAGLPLEITALVARGLAHEINNVLQIISAAAQVVARAPEKAPIAIPTIMRALSRTEGAIANRRLLFHLGATSCEIDDLLRGIVTAIEDSLHLQVEVEAQHFPAEVPISVAAAATLFVAVTKPQAAEKPRLILRSEPCSQGLRLSLLGLEAAAAPLAQIEQPHAKARLRWQAERAAWEMNLPVQGCGQALQIEAEVLLLSWFADAALVELLEAAGCGLIPGRASQIKDLLRDYGDEIDLLLIDGRGATEIEQAQLLTRLGHPAVKIMSIGFENERFDQSMPGDFDNQALLLALKTLTF